MVKKKNKKKNMFPTENESKQSLNKQNQFEATQFKALYWNDSKNAEKLTSFVKLGHGGLKPGRPWLPGSILPIPDLIDE